jgi:hypothetical protein
MDILYLPIGNKKYEVKFNPTAGLWGYLVIDEKVQTAHLINIPLVPSRVSRLIDRGALTNILKLISFPAASNVEQRDYDTRKRFILRTNKEFNVDIGEWRIHFTSEVTSPNEYVIEVYDGHNTHLEPEIFTIEWDFNASINGKYLIIN